MRAFNSFATLGLKNPTTLDIVAGAITIIQSSHIISAETGVADTLTQINIERANSNYAPFVVLKASAGHTISITVGGNYGGANADITDTSPGYFVYSNEDSLWYPLGSGGGGSGGSGGGFANGVSARSDASTLVTDRLGSDPVEAPIPFDGEVFDTDAYFDPLVSESLITIPSGLGGLYLFQAWVYINNNGTVTLDAGSVDVNIYINNAFPDWQYWEIFALPVGGWVATESLIMPFTWFMNLDDADDLEIRGLVYQAGSDGVTFAGQFYLWRLGDAVESPWPA